MNNKEIDRLFSKVAPKSTFKQNGQAGEGIGLSLTKELVEYNWGELKIKSQPQKGTIVKLVFAQMES